MTSLRSGVKLTLMKKKIFIVILFFILLVFLNSAQDGILNSSVVKNWLDSPNNELGEKYKLTCEIRLLDLKGTSLKDKSRFVGKTINLEIDTKVGVYSEDYKNEGDVVIIHGLSPEAKFSMTSDHLLTWGNELIIDENSTLYVYSSDIRKKKHSVLDKILKKDKAILNISISEYSLKEKRSAENLQKLFQKKQLEDGIITQKQFDEWMNNLKSLPTSNIDDLPKKYKGLFNFKFDCLKSEI
jgi:major membrane immunogen (membrane-anchored lipoprotein)